LVCQKNPVYERLLSYLPERLQALLLQWFE
jgi:hypothetical protein